MMKIIFKLLNKISKIMFLSLFFIIGSGLLLTKYVMHINSSYFKNPPSINEFSPGKIVKLTFVPDPDYIVKSGYSGTPCIFSKIEYIKYYTSRSSSTKTSIGSSRTSGRIEKTIIKPDYIVMKNQDNRYLLNLNDLKPKMNIDTKLFFLKDKTTGEYNQTTQIGFTSGDEVIRESLILPNDNITVFGKLVDIKNHPKENVKELKFYGEDFPIDPIDKFIKIAKNLPDYLANNKLIFYVLSTKNSIEIQNDMDLGIFLIVIGAFFTLLPGIFILQEAFSIFGLIASLAQPKNQTF